MLKAVLPTGYRRIAVDIKTPGAPSTMRSATLSPDFSTIPMHA